MFHRADSIYNAGNTKLAAVEYEYVAYNNESAITKADAYLKQTNCLKTIKLYDDMKKTLKRIDITQLDDNYKYKVLYETALCNYLSSNFGEAESAIIKMKSFVTDSNLINQCLLLEVLINNELCKWSEAKNGAEKYIRNKNISQSKKDSCLALINKFYKKPPKIKKPERAELFSTFVPGTGQYYSGYVLEGAVSQFLHLATFSSAIVLFVNGYYFTGFTYCLGSLQMFYTGNVKRAIFLAERANYLNIQNFNNNIKNILLN